MVPGPLAKRMGRSRRAESGIWGSACCSVWVFGALPTHQHLTHLSPPFCNFFFCSCSELQFLFWFHPPLCPSYSDSTQPVFKTMTSISQSQDDVSLAISWLSLYPHHHTAVLCKKGKCVVEQRSACTISVERVSRVVQSLAAEADLSRSSLWWYRVAS